ncbi:beta-lactamase family protein [Polaribacter sp. IC066]|nr:beta-lactamase family protein [Polaribacter sp. IC063]TXD60681.1 beta-lactamase family protein [Polaribacter sp. IC066]
MLFSCKQNSKVKKTYKKDYTAINDTLTKNLQSVFKKGTIVRFSVSIVDDQGFIYENGFGYTDIALTKKYTSNTTQNIASISKTLIVVSLLKAKEQGKLNLNEPINKYLPFNVINPNYPEKPILIKHLAYHTSSIVDIDEVYSKSYVLKKAEHNENKGLYDWFNMPKTKILLIDFIKNNLTVKGKWYTKEIFAITTPREIREYSNIGAAICAQIIEFATRQDYQSFTKDYIIKPLKRASSGWSSKDINTTKRSRLFATKKMLIAEYSLITSADGGFITSNKNLGLFLAEFMKDFKGEGKLLSKESYKKLFKKQQFSNIETEEKFGIFIEFSNEFIKIKNNVIGHNRSDPGVMKAMYFNQKTETGKILFVNTDSDFDANFWPKVALI